MTESIEQWRPIPGWEGLYEVSDLGRVRSLPRVDRLTRQHRGRVLTAAPMPSGHLQVNLSKDGKGSTMLVHHLVMHAFVGPRPEGTECCHLDGTPSNNALSNLRWDSRSGNVRDSVRQGTHYSPHRGTTHCPMNHPLEAPNLVPSGMRRGYRSCLACNRARSICRVRHVPFTKNLADAYYAKIVSG